MNQAETEIFLSQCDAAFELFKSQAPEFDNSESTMHAMFLTLQAEGRDPRSVHDLSAAWQSVRPAPVAPASIAEPPDALTLAAKRLISSCGGEHATRKIISDLSASEYARRSMDPVFVCADEILNPRATQPLLTRGDHVVAQGKRSREHTAQLTRETVEAVERSKRDISSGYANHREPEPAAEGGVPNPTGLSFGDRRAAANAPRRQVFTKEELLRNERENAARNRQPEKSRADAVREEQLRQGRARQERWSR